jgi:hypothetical protein
MKYQEYFTEKHNHIGAKMDGTLLSKEQRKLWKLWFICCVVMIVIRLIAR